MGYLGYDKIAVKGIDGLQTIQELEMNIFPNKHASMRVTGILDYEKGPEYIDMLLENKTIEIIELGEREKVIFEGIIVDAVIKERNDVFYIEAKGISGTYVLDMEKKSRSFQNTKLTYEQLIKQVIKDTSGSDAIFEIGEEEISVPIVQYRETDWEFIKRMASHFGASIVPEITSSKPRFWFGMRSGKNKELTDVMEYKVWKDIDSFNDKGGENEGYQVDSFLFYEIKTWQRFEIGDIIRFKNKDMLVCSISGRIEKSLWVYTYVLGSDEAVGIKKKYNSIISGMSIKGTVLDTKAERLKIHLDIDKEQDKNTAYWYPHVPATGNMMYCMPKIGTQVALYFPDDKEHHAKVTSCVRTNGAQCQDTSDPNKRYFTTEHNKQMALLPNSLSFSGVGNDKGPLKITLQQSAEEGLPGISLESHKFLGITAKGNIEFSSGKKIIVSATAEVKMGKFNGDFTGKPLSEIDIKFEFHISTKTVRILTTRFERFPPFNDAPKAFDKKKFWGTVFKALAVVAVVAVLAVVTCGTGPIVLGAIAGAAITVAFKAKDDWDRGETDSFGRYMTHAAAGAICGAISGFGGGVISSALWNMAGTEAGMIAEDFLNHGKLFTKANDYDGWDYLGGGVAGFLGGAIGGGITKVCKSIAAKSIGQMGSKQVKGLIGEFAEKFGKKYAIRNMSEAASTGEKKWIFAMIKAYKLNGKAGESFINRFSNLEFRNVAVQTTVKGLKGELGKDASINALKKLVKDSPDLFVDQAANLLPAYKKAIPTSVCDVAAEVSSRLEANNVLDPLLNNNKPKDETPQDGARYLVRGAKLKCKCGSHSRMANLPLCHGTYTTDEPILCQIDNVPQNGPEDSVEGKNIMIFGACSSPSNNNESACYQVNDGVDRKGNPKTKKVEGKKCTPVLVGGWKQAKSDVLINDSCALTTESWLQCLHGGIIKVEDSGQVLDKE